ncbi:MAG TPA: hypothetical protein VIY90_23750 [Steroidobacteraceae bacterium]
MKRKAFRLAAILAPMYPPKASDAQIRALIGELASAAGFPSGAQLRQALAERFDCRGGVARIYRLLAAQRGQVAQAALGAGSFPVRLLEHELATLRQQLAHTAAQAQAQQRYWTERLRQLHENIQQLQVRIERAPTTEERAALSREAQALDTQGGRLEVMLRAFGPAVQARSEQDPEVEF